MKHTNVLAGALLGLAAAAVINAPAQAAEAATDCREVTVNLTDRDDTGTDGTVWAKDALTRTVKVCLTGTAGDGKSTYSATVTDTGTFKTVTGTSPKAGVPLVAGIDGTVNGGFEVAKFTADTWKADSRLTAPGQATTSSQWVNVAFPGADTSITTYHWAYKTACESYTDNNGVYAGDITKACPSPEPTTASPSASASASASASPSRSVSTSAAAPVPSQSTSQAGLPVTGSRSGVVFGLGAALVVLGGAAIAVARRRRTKFEA